MTFRVRIDPVAQRHIDEFAVYLCQYSEEFAIEQIDRLNRIISSNLGQSPLTWAHFAFTGAPIAPICFASGAARNTGLSTPSTKKPGRSTFFISGTPAAIRTRSTCKLSRR
jgi:hypothetical protein